MSTNKRVEGNTLPVMIVLGGLLFAGFIPANAANAPTHAVEVSSEQSVSSLGGAQSDFTFSVVSASGILGNK